MKPFTVKKLMAVVAFLALLLSFLIVPATRVVEFHRLRGQIGASVGNLHPTDPGIDPVAWECAHGWTVTAYANICVSPDVVPTSELHRFRDDLDAKLKGDVDLGTLAWIWERLGKTGPLGKRYTDRFQETFLACFPAPANAPK